MAEVGIAPEVVRFKNAQAVQTEKLDLPKREDIDPRYLDIAERIAKISGTWNPVEIYTASSEDIAREKTALFESFENGEEYNPTLSYPVAESLDFSNAKSELTDIEKGLLKEMPAQDDLNRIARVVLVRKIRDDLATCDLVEGIKEKNEKKIADALKRKYPGTDDVLMAIAENFYKRYTVDGEPQPKTGEGELSPEEYDWLKKKIFNPEEQKKAFEYALDAYGILRTDENPKGYKVVIDENATSLDVRDKSLNGPTLYVPTNRPSPMTGDQLLPLIAHEIEGHARQSMNGEELFIIGGGPLRIDNEQLYEGYGLRLESDIKRKLFGIAEEAPSARRILYPFAVEMAETGASFYKIFSDQVERRIRIDQKIPHDQDFPELSAIDESVLNKAMDEAWLVTYRVMRGHTDMSNLQSYAMAKDLGYLRGWVVDSELVNEEFGHINESGVIGQNALPLLARFEFSEADIPEKLKYKNVTRSYWEEVLKPQFDKAIT